MRSIQNNIIHCTTAAMLSINWGYSQTADPKKAVFIRMEKLAVDGNAEAQAWLANNYADGTEGVPQNAQKALYWDQKAADQNVPVAQYNMAVRYQNGNLVVKNIQLAIKWYETCANNAFGKWQSEAQASLGLRYYEGNGVPKDHLKAYGWLTKSALQGHVPSIFVLSDWHLSKQDKEDQHIGLAMLETAASKGLPQAQFRLAIYYSDGKLVPPDFPSAVAWSRKASDQGYSRAQFLLGNFLFEGKGTNKDEKQGAMYCIKAAEQGDFIAEAFVAKLYTEGRGVPTDLGQAKKWIKRWASHVLSNAEQAYNNKEISLDDLQRARKTVTDVEELD